MANSKKRTPKRRSADGKLTRQQLGCLSSLVRVDLYEAIQRRRQASVLELAEDLKKSPHSLYYHIKQLLNVKLIQIGDYRRVGKRDEALYEVVAERLKIDQANTGRDYREAIIKTVGSALRKAEREHRDARMRQVDHERFALTRIQATLSHEDARILREKTRQLNQWVRKRNISGDEIEGEDVSLTCLVVPIDSVD